MIFKTPLRSDLPLSRQERQGIPRTKRQLGLVRPHFHIRIYPQTLPFLGDLAVEVCLAAALS
jgi:hypothetical protein